METGLKIVAMVSLTGEQYRDNLVNEVSEDAVYGVNSKRDG
jgi:hypothetical protein